MSTKVSIATQSATTKPKKNRKGRSKINMRKARRQLRMRRRSIPVAYSMRANAHASIVVRDTSASLTSVEIFPVTARSSGCALLIPMTPTKWSSTRTAQLAATYDSFRPLQCSVSWEPAVSTSTPGSVAIGTVFAGCRLPSDNSWGQLSSALAATNGGLISTIWDHSSTTVSLQKNLRANLFPLYNVDPDDIPFWICVASNASSDSTLGYIVLKTKFTLRNPAVPGSKPPLSGRVEADFNHNSDTNTTTMSVPSAALNRAIEIGQDIIFTFGQQLVNTASQVGVNILEGVIARVTALSGGAYQFSVDNSIATQSAIGYVIGVGSNF